MKLTVLLADDDVIIRLAVGEYLRHCGHKVIEAANGEEAKAILQAGLEIDVLLSDAQLAGPNNGFALAHWIRRYRPSVEIILTSTVSGKAQTAAEFCARFPTKAPYDSSGLATRIRAMVAERRRRARPPSSTAPSSQRKRRRS